MWRDKGSNAIPEFVIHDKFQKTTSLVEQGSMWEMSFPQSNGCADNSVRYAARYAATSVEEHERVVHSLLAVYKGDRICVSDFFVVDARDTVFDNDNIIPMGDLLTGKLCYDAGSSHASVHTSGSIHTSKVVITNTLTGEKLTVETINCEVKRDDKDTALHDRDPTKRGAVRYPWTGKNLTDDVILSEHGTYGRRMKIVVESHSDYIKSLSQVSPMLFDLCVNTYTNDVTLCTDMRRKLLGDIKRKYAASQRVYYKLHDPSPAWRSLSFDDKRKANYDEHDSWLEEKRYITHIQHQYFTRVYKDDLMLSTEQRKMMKYRADDKFTTMIHDMDKDDIDQFNKDAMRYWVLLK